MKAHLYHHLPHKPYGQRLPHHQTNIYLSNSIIEEKVIKARKKISLKLSLYK